MSNEISLTKIAFFREKQIRKVIHQNEWWFSIIDVVEALTETARPRKYWSDLKKKLIKEGYIELSDKIGQLKLKASDGKEYITDCSNTESLFRIIQAIPSPKAEPFKRWLAKVGYERIQEIEDPDEGGSVAGNARKDLEQKSGDKVMTQKNYLIKKL